MGRPRILVVDDDRSICAALSRTLEADGLQVACAEDPRAVAARVRGWQPALLLLDVQIGTECGLELCRELRAEHPAVDLPIVFITGHEDRSVLIEALEVGGDELLRKPLDPTELRLRVRNLLELQRHRRSARDAARRLEEQVELRSAQLRATLADLGRTSDRLRLAYEETLARLANAAEYRDPETGRHLERMSRYSETLARAVGLDAGACKQLRLAAPMHDIGKIGIPDAILLKPGKLTADEFERMKEHTVFGHRLLAHSDSPLLNHAAEIAMSHHERWDGSGYPHELAGAEIPLSGRIVAVADVFDALTSARCYKPAYPLEQALDALRAGAGHHFDPTLVDAFFSVLDEVEAIRSRWPDAPAPEHPMTEDL